MPADDQSPKQSPDGATSAGVEPSALPASETPLTAAAPTDIETPELDDAIPQGGPFPIVGIGASAGGLEALTQLFRALPKEPAMAFVVVQHLDPEHASQLPELLTH